MDWQRSRKFSKDTRATSSAMKLTNVPAPDYLDKFLCHAVFFQGPTKERWKRFQARHSIQFSKDYTVS